MRMAESDAKKKILEVVEQLPDDATIEDAIERLYFLAKSRTASGKRTPSREKTDLSLLLL